MRIENGKRVRNRAGDNVPTEVVSFRAEPCVIEMIKKQMAKENYTHYKRSEFIIRVLTEYCDKNGRE